jgi:hypothetical protein
VVGRKVKHRVDPFGRFLGEAHALEVALDEFDVVFDVGEVDGFAAREVVSDADVGPFRDEVLDEVAADERCAAGDECRLLFPTDTELSQYYQSHLISLYLILLSPIRR